LFRKEKIIKVRVYIELNDLVEEFYRCLNSGYFTHKLNIEFRRRMFGVYTSINSSR
jgi:hypothetical protein